MKRRNLPSPVHRSDIVCKQQGALSARNPWEDDASFRTDHSPVLMVNGAQVAIAPLLWPGQLMDLPHEPGAMAVQDQHEYASVIHFCPLLSTPTSLNVTKSVVILCHSC